MEVKELTRKELFDLVWSTSLVKLTVQYAYSNEGLKNICKEFEIPMPDVGYWTKLKFKKEVEKPTLNSLFQGEDKIILALRQDKNLVNIDKSPITTRTKEIISESKSPLIVAEKLGKPDILIQNTKLFFDKKKNDGYFMDEKIDMISIYVEKNNFNRALRIMDTFIKLLRYRGHSFRRDRNNRGPRIVVNDVEFHFQIREKNKRIPSDKPYSSSTFIPTGILIIKIGESFHAKEWNDGTLKLENQLAKIVATIELEADKELVWREECRINRLKREEEEKLRIEFQKKRENELKKTKQLFNDAIFYNNAKIVREYLNDIEVTAVKNNQLTNELQGWLNWAIDKTDWFDPLTKKEDSLLNNSDKEELISIKKNDTSFYRY
ncbi:hypothetical protein [Flavobacterium sp. LAR06]|uniref:hypothetical protein n=1 Tax=Flavobacterium sp. LAR06 TaxID=3064897 RepID=UPI0035C0AC47